ncbi:MAG: hypothetical protein EOM74_01085, partial [Methanomicrobia archaeon]|nr:hypothetical protein [Methanomicrobia archaeon]
MIDIIKIATFLETKLNENTSGFFFRVYTFEKTLDRRYEKDEQGQRYDITPAIITTPIGSYLPQNQMRGMRLSFNLEAMIPLSKKEQWIEMINSFVWSVNGKVFYLLDNGTLTETQPSENYQTLKMSLQVPSFGTVGPSNIEVVKQINSYIPIRTTEDYIAINIPISMNTIKDFFIGDERKVWMALVT